MLMGANNHGVSTAPRTAGARTTPMCILFAADWRMIGDAAKNLIAMNVKNTVVDAKCLIGRSLLRLCQGGHDALVV